MQKSNFLSHRNVKITDGFFEKRCTLNRNVSINNVRKRFEETGRFDALRFNYLKTGKAPEMPYDSDVAKWIEAVAYEFENDPEGMDEHIALCEELIDCMENAQRPDGYLNSTHQQIVPYQIFKVRGNHELYCAGHLIEAAVAYAEATGKEKFLHIMERYCDCIYRAFISEKTAGFESPGHEEIELALAKLYRYTGNSKYLEMAEYFLSRRGHEDITSHRNGFASDNIYYAQDDVDMYHLREANGHAVRALYYYCGIADLAYEKCDEALLESLESVFEDISKRKIYITGGVGSSWRSESFTSAYDLPNRTAYTESCAAISMIFFAYRMRMLNRSAKYGDVAERVLYNALLSSTSIDGKAFFYENPLEIALEEYDKEPAAIDSQKEHLPIKERVEVFECSCCPPNICRFFGELGDFICIDENNALTVEQYISSSIKSNYGRLEISEKYATEGKVKISSKDYSAETISLRVPAWCKQLDVKLNGKAIATPDATDGYITLEVGTSFEIELDTHISPRAIASNPKVRENVGRAALTYGPVVYCLEGIDNGERLNQIEVDFSAEAKVSGEVDFHGFYSLTLPAYRDTADDRLYFNADECDKKAIRAKFIPYYAFANRGESDMLVFVRKH